MNKERRKQLADAIKQLEAAIELVDALPNAGPFVEADNILEDCAGAERETFDNMPDRPKCMEIGVQFTRLDLFP